MCVSIKSHNHSLVTTFLDLPSQVGMAARQQALQAALDDMQSYLRSGEREVEIHKAEIGFQKLGGVSRGSHGEVGWWWGGKDRLKRHCDRIAATTHEPTMGLTTHHSSGITTYMYICAVGEAPSCFFF